jgi:hypothetical protein
MYDNDAIAVLLSGYDDAGRPTATVVLRDARGHLSLRHIGSRAARRSAASARTGRGGQSDPRLSR